MLGTILLLVLILNRVDQPEIGGRSRGAAAISNPIKKAPAKPICLPLSRMAFPLSTVDVPEMLRSTKRGL